MNDEYKKTRNLKAAVSVYWSIVESTLLYASETWVLTGCLFRINLTRSIPPKMRKLFKWTIYTSTRKWCVGVSTYRRCLNWSPSKLILRNVAKYLTPESTAMAENIEINMEKVCSSNPQPFKEKIFFKGGDTKVCDYQFIYSLYI